MSYPARGWQEAAPDRGVAGRWCALPDTWPTGGDRRTTQVVRCPDRRSPEGKQGLENGNIDNSLESDVDNASCQQKEPQRGLYCWFGPEAHAIRGEPLPIGERITPRFILGSLFDVIRPVGSGTGNRTPVTWLRTTRPNH